MLSLTLNLKQGETVNNKSKMRVIAPQVGNGMGVDSYKLFLSNIEVQLLDSLCEVLKEESLKGQKSK